MRWEVVVPCQDLVILLGKAGWSALETLCAVLSLQNMETVETGMIYDLH